jgi:hypothetical protein
MNKLASFPGPDEILAPGFRPHPLLADVEEFLARTGVSPTAFGRDAMGDPRFVFDLRGGREPHSATEHRARVQMATYHTYLAFDENPPGRRRRRAG